MTQARPRQMRRLPTPLGPSRLPRQVIFEDTGTPTPSGTRPASILTVSDSPSSHAAHKIPYNPDDPEEADTLLPPALPQTLQSQPSPLPPGAGEVDPAIRRVIPGWARGGKYSRLESLVYDDTSPGFDPRKLFSPASSATQFSDADSPASYSFLKSLSPGVYPPSSGFPKKPRPHAFIEGCEPPQWRNLALHVALCGLAYPFLFVFVIAAAGKTLFWARVSVGVGSGILGAMLGISLVGLARGMLEAATWATVIHQSRVPDRPGVKFKDLATQSSDPHSALPALRLLWQRHSYPGTIREYRNFYDSKPWTLVILFFIANVVLSGLLTFAFGRIVFINVQVLHQYETYYEVAVKGDLTDIDIQRAADIRPAFENLHLTWTLAPFSSHGNLPPVVSFQRNNDSVYFSEVIISQLLPNGSGFGTFEANSTAPSINLGPLQTGKSVPSTGIEVGSVLRFPRWGIRIKCAKIPDPINILPISNNSLTYLYTPRDTLRHLFDWFDIPFPDDLKKVLNASDPNVLVPGDTIPDGLDWTSIALSAYFSNNGVAHNMKSTPLKNMGDDGTGFMTVENILVRLNNTYAPNGNFSTSGSSILGPDGNSTFIGYDAAVCLELYEPWILEVYNSSVGLPNTLRIVDKGATIIDMNTRVMRERLIGGKLTDPDVKRHLNSTGSMDVYIAGHQNSVNQILKDNGRDSYYVPSPTLVSFTGGQGPYGYTQLSEDSYAKARALADGSNVLPYFVGSASTLARSYPDSVVTKTGISNVAMAMTLLVVLFMGITSAFFVPRLPMGAPRRGFDLYSWMSAFDSRELVAERNSGINRDMDLVEIVERVGDLRFRYVEN